jgi:predicted SAM-dependent methyltransferase
MKCFLNVGGGDKGIAVPAYFEGWRHDRLDIDPAVQPEVLCDARELQKLAPQTDDAVYCSHNLEHYHRHDALKVMRGFAHVLKLEGFAQIHVPNILGMMKVVVEQNLDVDDVLYECPAGPVHVFDLIYGFQKKIEESGVDFFAHKTCFSAKSLMAAMMQSGFAFGAAGTNELDLYGFFFRTQPTVELCRMLGIGQAPVKPWTPSTNPLVQ